MGEYLVEAQGDAKDAAKYFFDEIVTNIVDEGDQTRDTAIGDYSDESYFGDKSYGLKEAVEVLEDLSDYEENDSGLWEGLDPKEAVEAMAAYTYINAATSLFQELMEYINNVMGEAMGVSIFFDFNEWLEAKKQAVQAGVLDWMPAISDEELEEQEEALQEEHGKEIKEAVKKVVKEAIERW